MNLKVLWVITNIYEYIQIQVYQALLISIILMYFVGKISSVCS
jgi:hypothetical protein